MKKVCLLLSLVLFLSVTLTSVALGNDGTVATAGSDKYEVWGAPSTVKILRDQTDYGNKKPCALTYHAVKGEYESYQLMISAKEDIDEYYLQVNDVTDGNGNSITAENFTVYNEYYTRVDITSHSNAKIGGYYPDALIPIDLAKEAGELVIAGGNNGALWVTVHIPADAVAGNYSGEFTLTVADDIVKIPVTIEVYDYVLTEESHFRTLYNLWDAGLANGEKDTTIEMKEKYYEFFLDYRINLDRLPLDSMDTDELVTQAKKYANDPRVTNYDLPYRVTGGCFYNGPLFQSQILALAKNSTEELNLLKKAMLYFIDEPEGNNTMESAISQGRELKAMLQDVVAIIEADADNEYAEFKQIDNWQSYIVDIPNLMTSIYGTSEMYQLYNTWCPCWDKWYTASGIAKNEQIAKEMDKDIWWYGCMSPRDPYPQYHIDGALLSSRAVNWLAQCYDIVGNLYWGTVASNNTDIYDLPKDTTESNTNPPGDGYLCYPGFKYGYHGPLPSMRLMSVRDGYEEYELLYALQNSYTELYEDLDAKEAVHNIYSPIHENIKTNTDIDLFDAVRLELLANVTMIGGDINFAVETITVEDDVAIVEMRLNSSKFDLQINGEAITAMDDNLYVYALSLTENASFEVKVIDKSNSKTVVNFYKIVG